MSNFQLFVYGSLKKGMSNHHFCKRATVSENALLCGRLYQLPQGYPALQVPSANVIWYGTDSILKDARVQEGENRDSFLNLNFQKGWNLVHGELVTFANPEVEIPPIDCLEGYPWHYTRELVPVRHEDGRIIAAWAYTMYKLPDGAKLLPDGVWPEISKQKTRR